MATELLAPAGNREKMQVACRFGADAVYVGGKVFGLRKYADNFTDAELAEAVAWVHQKGKKIYVVLNGFAHDDDLRSLRPHLAFLDHIQPDAVIVSDWAVAEQVLTHTRIPLHVSTQASVIHWRGVQRWVDLGAKRVILGREVTLDDCREIQERVPTELEVFIHGAMCASYSGKCVISNYSAGRDANRGGCVQSCRHRYHLEAGGQQDTRYMMNAKDLMAVRWLQAGLAMGLASFKIEGRMKSAWYVANATRVYREAIDAIDAAQGSPIDPVQLEGWETQLKQVSNRTFSGGGFDALQDGLNQVDGGYQSGGAFVGTVIQVHHDRSAVDIRVPVVLGDSLSRLTPQGVVPLTVTDLWDVTQRPVTQLGPGALGWMAGTWEVGDVLIR